MIRMYLQVEVGQTDRTIFRCAAILQIFMHEN
jgi:hypothetical protein